MSYEFAVLGPCSTRSMRSEELRSGHNKGATTWFMQFRESRNSEMKFYLANISLNKNLMFISVLVFAYLIQ